VRCERGIAVEHDAIGDPGQRDGLRDVAQQRADAAPEIAEARPPESGPVILSGDRVACAHSAGLPKAPRSSEILFEDGRAGG
jgi:hypothetical protein